MESNYNVNFFIKNDAKAIIFSILKCFTISNANIRIWGMKKSD